MCGKVSVSNFLSWLLPFSLLTAIPTWAQDVESIEVTGSRLKRLDLDIASPVTVIDRQMIEASGKISVADLLREVSANTFGSQREQTGRAGGAQSFAGINLRGLGQQRTLVLLNGRRLANSPAVPDAQNLNLIPMSAIERVEILKDGASSIYGSDAVGGVVNIILRKNLDGHALSTHVKRPGKAGGDENYLAGSGGFVSNTGSVTYSLSYGTRENVFNRDRQVSAVGLSPYGFPASYSVIVADPDNPDKSIIKSFADPRCPDSLGTSEVYPNSVADGDQCKYNFAAESDHLPEYQRANLFLNGDWQLANGLVARAQLGYTRLQSNGIYAPTPQVGGEPFLPVMAAGNPNNPTQGQVIGFDSNGDGNNNLFLTGPFDIQISYRNLPGGNRLSEVIDDSSNLLLGLEGDTKWFGGSEFRAAVQYNKNKTSEYETGLASRAALQQALDNGSFDLFAVNGQTDTALASTFAIDSSFDAAFTLIGADFVLNTELFRLTHGRVNMALGVDVKHHKYHRRFHDDFDGELIDGRAGGGSAEGDRNIASLFSELDLPVGKGLSVNLALRADHYSDFGTAVSPKLGLTWRYNKDWLFRLSTGRGFRAPSLFELYSKANQSFPMAIDELQCNGAGDADGDGVDDKDQNVDTLPANSPCLPVSIQVISEGNEELEAETSHSTTLGFVYQPREGMRLAVNYFHQEFSNQIGLFSLFDMLSIEADEGQYPDILRNEVGQIIQVNNRYDNFSGARAQGFDLELSYQWQAQNWGRFSFTTDISAMLSYQVERLPDSGFIDVEDSIGSPDSRFNMSLSWHRGAWSSHVSALIVPSMAQQNTELGSWVPVDFRVSYDTSWRGKITLGAENLFDAEPPTSRGLGHPYYLAGLADITGRAMYIRYNQQF